MKSRLMLGVAALVGFGAVTPPVLAHDGASGVVIERMELMIEMKEAVKTLSDMFRGATPYDAAKVRAAAKVLEQNSGENLTQYFPEGSLQKPSESKAIIWNEWGRFEALANNLQRFSKAFDSTAQRVMSPSEGTLGGSGSGMGGSMMGGSSMMGGGQGMMGSGQGLQSSEEHLAQMPPQRLFQMVTNTCSACHARYRKEGED